MYMNVPGDVKPSADWEQRGIDRAADFNERGTAYSAMQSTVPYTLGAILQSSPVATVVYISEKLFRWTAPDSHPSIDEAVAHSMLYWLTGSLASSCWLYYNRRGAAATRRAKLMVVVNVDREAKLVAETRIEAPARITMGQYELRWPPRKVAEQTFPNLREYKLLDAGGHFAALERPEVRFAFAAGVRSGRIG